MGVGPLEMPSLVDTCAYRHGGAETRDVLLPPHPSPRR